MKFLRFIKLLPILFYSYVFYYCQSRISYEVSSYPEWYDAAILLSFLASVIAIVIEFIMCLRGKYTARETAIHAMILKVVPIYACIGVVFYAMIFAIVPIFGWLGATVIVFYLVTIMAMTGSVQVCSIICLFKEKRISLPVAFICAVLSYWVVLDIVVAIFLIHRSGKVNGYSYIVNA